MNLMDELNELQRQAGVLGEASPDVTGGFYGLCQTAYKSNTKLEMKMQQLVLLGILTAIDSKEGIMIHMGMYLQAGGTREELVEALNMVMIARGGPAVATAGFALDVYDKLAAANA